MKQSLAGASNYAGSMSFEPATSLPCGFREALRALIKGPGVGIRAEIKMSRRLLDGVQRRSASARRARS